MNDRHIVAAGFVLCLAGVVLMLVPGGAGQLPALVATLLVVGVVCLGLVVAASSALSSEGESVRLPTPERRPHYRQPGTRLGERLDSVDLVGRRALSEEVAAVDGTAIPRERLQADLHELAVHVLTRTTGCTRESADTQLAEGSWTDDAAAAAFFTEGLTPSLSWRHWLPGGLSPSLPTVDRARHVIDALTEQAAGETVDPDQRTTNPPVETSYWLTDSLPVTQSTGRLRQLAIAVVLVSGVGVLFGHSGMVLATTMGIAFAAAARFSSPTVALTLSRTLDDTRPAPGDEVTVTVTVRNDSDRTLADLRLLDGVPSGLEVIEESPRFSTALRPGKAATFTYTVEAVEGTHQFEPAIAIASDYLGTTERVESVRTEGEPTELSCGFEADAPRDETPLPQVTVLPGVVEADASGAGVEFDTVREYRVGDPLSRIDWHRRAKTGELSTVAFREPHQPRVVLLVDARQTAYVAPADEGIPAPRYSARAAASVGVGLLENVVPVGVATIGTDCWIPPQCGGEQQTKLRTRLAGTDVVPWTPPDDSTPIEDVVTRLETRLASETQLVVFSPLTDDDSVELCRRLDATGHAVSVVSPDCTGTATVERAYGRLERWRRCSELRNVGIPVSDWQPDGPGAEVRVDGTQ